MITVFIRTILIYVFLLAAMRFLGKRQIGELQLSELITTLMLSELAVTPIADADVPISYAILPILIILSLEVIVSCATARWVPLRKFLIGSPSLLIYHGRLNVEEMKKQRIGAGELLSELRQKDVADIREVRYAILEDNGKLSVFSNAADSPLMPKDVGVDAQEDGVALPLIVGGLVMKDSMRHANVSREQLEHLLKRLRVTRREVLLMTVDEQRTVSYILKDSPDGKIREVKL
jgi:uncharacterized membrane protein YcaP (DUF421 family)